MLLLEQPCELLQDVSGGEHVIWRNLELQEQRTIQPRWHSWQDSCSLVEVNQQAGTAKVQKQQRRTEQVTDRLFACQCSEQCMVVLQ